MQQLSPTQKSMLYGAAAATATGLLFGMMLKVEVAPSSSYGRQLLVSQPVERGRTAFDNWYPAESAPPPVYQTADLRDGASAGDAIDRQIARLLNFGRAEAAPAYPPEPAPVQMARREPEPQVYLPSERGDILASEDYPPAQREYAPAPPPRVYVPPPAEAPRWGWALPHGEAASDSGAAPPPYYEGGAAG